MESKIILLIVMLLVICTFIYFEDDSDVVNENNKYQGPVPEGYDIEHFSNTGETIKLNNSDMGDNR